MEIRLKLWHVLAGLFIVIALIWFAFSAWKQDNTNTINQLKYDIKQNEKIYKQRQKALDSFIVLAEGEHRRAIEAEERAAQKDSIIANLSQQKIILVNRLNNEKIKINNLDSVGQYKLLRANLTKLLNGR